MKKAVPKLLGALLLTAGPLLAFGSTESAEKGLVPALLEAKGAKGNTDTPAVWVSAQSAATPTGEVDWDLLGAQAFQTYQGVIRSTPPLLAKPAGDNSPPEYDPNTSGLRPDCVYYGAAYFDTQGLSPGNTLKDVVNNARAVFRGQIVAMTPGFYLGEPNTLLTVSVDRMLRSSSDFAKGGLFYVIYPYARFRIGKVNFCKGDTDYPYRPEVGDSVMVFPFRAARDKSGRLVLPRPQELFFERNGRVTVPRKFEEGEEGSFKNLDDLEKRTLDSN